MEAIILAAGMATRLQPLTLHTPKCLLTVNGRSLLQRSMDALIHNEIKDITIVTGFLSEKICQFVSNHYGNSVNVKFIYNDKYETTNNIYSLWLARPQAEGKDILLLDSDLLYDPCIIEKILTCSDKNVLSLIKHNLSDEEMKVVVDAKGSICQINKTCSPTDALGESLGIEKMDKSYTAALYKELEIMMNKEHLENKFYEMAFERLIAQEHTFKVMDVTPFFSCELDTVEDFERAKKLIPF